MTESAVDRPGLSTPAEDAAWSALRQRIVISLRPIGAPTPIGLLGLAAATFVLSGLQLGWVDQAEGKVRRARPDGVRLPRPDRGGGLQPPRPRRHRGDGDVRAGPDLVGGRAGPLHVAAGIDE